MFLHDVSVVYSRLGGGCAMPTERLRIASGLNWCWTVIRVPRIGGGLETELFFEIEGRPFSLAFDAVPERPFLHRLFEVRSVAVYEISSEERGWVEVGRYRVVINDDHEDMGAEAVTCDHVRWSPENLA